MLKNKGKAANGAVSWKNVIQEMDLSKYHVMKQWKKLESDHDHLTENDSIPGADQDLLDSDSDSDSSEEEVDVRAADFERAQRKEL